VSRGASRASRIPYEAETARRYSFPKCFGPNENEPLDPAASESAFKELLETVRAETKSEMTLDEMVYGFVTVANETMARPIRTLTEARGYATAKHV
jgi:5-oxoprolinase (ATP-hydrolysing)